MEKLGEACTPSSTLLPASCRSTWRQSRQEEQVFLEGLAPGTRFSVWKLPGPLANCSSQTRVRGSRRQQGPGTFLKLPHVLSLKGTMGVGGSPGDPEVP